VRRQAALSFVDRVLSFRALTAPGYNAAEEVDAMLDEDMAIEDDK
jgi:hypothetical protein